MYMLGLWTLKEFAGTPMFAPVPLFLDCPAKPHPSQASRDATGHSEGECVDKAWAAPNARNFPSISLESPSSTQAASFPRGLPSPLPSPTGLYKTKGLQIMADPPKSRPLLPLPVPTA